MCFYMENPHIIFLKIRYYDELSYKLNITILYEWVKTLRMLKIISLIQKDRITQEQTVVSEGGGHL